MLVGLQRESSDDFPELTGQMRRRDKLNLRTRQQGARECCFQMRIARQKNPVLRHGAFQQGATRQSRSARAVVTEHAQPRGQRQQHAVHSESDFRRCHFVLR